MKSLLFTVLTFSALFSMATGAAPTLISYQGRLTDVTGNPLSGTYPIQFAIYTSPGGGTYVWEETQPNVSVNDGLFTVLLGSIAPIPDTAFKDANRYLGIKVGQDPELTPRTRLVSVPWSNRVASVDGASGGNITSKVTIGSSHTNTGDDAFVAGYSNTVSGPQSNIAGGRYNEVSGGSTVIAGGEYNYAPGSYTAISGGVGNQTDGRSSTISGGDTNRVFSTGYAGTIAGGRHNEVSDTCASVGGGRHNIATGRYSVIAGGGNSYTNEWNLASGDYSAIGGGSSNTASGSSSAVPGGYFNRATGDHSFAAGFQANAQHPGCFVWSDDFGGGTSSTAGEQFVVGATGGAFFKKGRLTVTTLANSFTTVSAGERWFDNSIVAWGKVSGGTGSISSNEFGVTSVVRNSAGNYTVTIDATAASAAELIATANAEVDVAPNSAASMRFVTINQVTNNSFDVYVTNGSFTPTDNDFVFIVTAR